MKYAQGSRRSRVSVERIRTITVTAVLSLLCTLLAAAASRPLLAQDGPVPAPELRPQDVVRIQLEALQANDEQDGGIGVAFRFASPSNKRSTGPLPRFAQMIKTGPYALMLVYRSAAYEEVEVAEDRARQRVTLVGDRGAVGFEFYLSRQREGDCVGCWMTDAVTVVPVSARPA